MSENGNNAVEVQLNVKLGAEARSYQEVSKCFENASTGVPAFIVACIVAWQSRETQTHGTVVA
jgi:hypothetical protein